MTIELAIDPRTLARRGGPATSHQAARRVSEFARQHHQQILGVMAQHPEGLTVHEIASLCKLDAHAVGKRMSELQRAGEVAVLVDLMGEVTRPTPSGRPARVWCAEVPLKSDVDAWEKRKAELARKKGGAL